MAENPFAKYAQQAVPQADPIIAIDPYKVQDQANQNVTTATNVADTAHDNRTSDVKLRVDNPQTLRKEFNALPEVRAYTVATQQLSQALSTGEGPQADLSLTYAFAKAMDPDSVVRESETASVANSQAWLDKAAENVKKQFGMDGAGNYTPEARAALRQQMIRSVASRNKIYQQRREEFEELARRNNIDPFEVVGEHTGEAYIDQARAYDQKRRDAGANVAPVGALTGGTAAADDPATPPPFSPGDPGYQRATGDTRTISDPETQSEVDAMLRRGASYGEINRYAVSRGMTPVRPAEYAAARKYLKENPNYKGSLVNAQKYEPVTPFEKVTTTIGDNPVGAYAIGAGQFLSGNTLDNMAGDPERARLAMNIQQTKSPVATLAGNVSGGVIAGLTGEALLGGAGMAPGIARGFLADTAMGAANGAGAADTGSRWEGGAKGALAAGAGNLAGNALARGGARVIAPSGGNLNPLYDAGVRSITPGQRFANSGVAGNALNRVEESMQSLPIVGSAVRGARQQARDDFQIGAFNEALKEVGEQLPKGTKPGTDPHAYAQSTFKRVYATARQGMTMVADTELKNDLGNLAGDVGALGPQAQGKLKAILANSVNKRLQDGQMSGQAYKEAVSDLGKHIARNRKGAMADDQALADVLEGVQGALDASARRHSNPDAVALLDAADAGYAKFVRIEDAARRRGGDAGTFSPSQFDASVQNTSGGIRSKAYLRGDALMQDYAKAGRSLEDKVPNSGTADRQLTVGGLGMAAIFGPLALPYAPGVRKLTTEALAPSGPKARAVAAQIRKRARLIGAAGASSAAAALPGTSPGP